MRAEVQGDFTVAHKGIRKLLARVGVAGHCRAKQGKQVPHDQWSGGQWLFLFLFVAPV
jgi:hypothetical protein